MVAAWAGGCHECDFLVLLSSDCQLILYPAGRSIHNELLDLKLEKLSKASGKHGAAALASFSGSDHPCSVRDGHLISE